MYYNKAKIWICENANWVMFTLLFNSAAKSAKIKMTTKMKTTSKMMTTLKMKMALMINTTPTMKTTP